MGQSLCGLDGCHIFLEDRRRTVDHILGLLQTKAGNVLDRIPSISDRLVEGDQEAINAVLNCGLVFYLGLSAIIVGLTVILRGPIASLLSIPPAIYSQSMFAILGMVLVFSLSNTFSIFEAVLVGLQRMDVQNKILIVASFFNVGGTIFFLESGYGIRGLVINQGIFTLVIVLLNAVFSRRLAPYLRLGLSRMRKDVFRKLFGYGTKMQICNFAVMVHSQADKIILSHFLGLSFVTFYELGQKAANAVRTFPMLLLTALVPAVSELDAGNDQERMMRLYHRGSKYVSLMVFPLIFFSIIVARNVFDLWVGNGFGLAVLAFQILVIGYGINVLTGMGTSLVRGIGKPEYETRYAVLALVTQLVLSIVLVQVVGYRGVLISVLFTAVINSVARRYRIFRFRKTGIRKASSLIRFRGRNRLWRRILLEESDFFLEQMGPRCLACVGVFHLCDLLSGGAGENELSKQE